MKCRITVNPYYVILVNVLLITSCSTYTSPIKIGSPEFSPEGDAIVFTRTCDDGESYSVVKAYLNSSEGLDKILLQDSLITSKSNPAYFSDGKRILYSIPHEGGVCADICISDLISNRKECLTQNGYGGWNPIISSDEKKIYFVSACEEGDKTYRERFSTNLPTESNVYSIDLDGLNRSKLFELNDYLLYDLSLSNNGNHILMFRKNYKQKDSLWIYTLNTGSISAFRPDISSFIPSSLDKTKEKYMYSYLYLPRFSPIENRMAFVWSGHGQGHYGHEIYLTDIDTKKTVKITDMRSTITSLEFSPDGNRIVFVVKDSLDSDDPSIWSINIDGAENYKILDGKDVCSK